MAKHHTTPQVLSASQQAGLLGETFVAAWWKQQGWRIVSERWKCRWGELDVVVRSPPPAPPKRIHTLAFVEVKTRATRNWDQDGLLAITPQKQTKLIRTAQTFLSEFPAFANDACRFDVAAIQCDRLTTAKPALPNPLELNQYSLKLSPDYPHTIHHHTLTLRHYIPNAFDLS